MAIEVKKLPPDGGYGWIVTLAYALNNVVVLPLIAGFALVLQNTIDISLTASQATTVITLNHGIGMLLSFFGGPTLRRFGYRKVAIVGALAIFAGLIFTSMSTTYWMFILSYSIINSMGVAAVMAAFTLAINSFFKEKRGRAIGIGMFLTGLGAINMPLLMSLLISTYDWRGAVLVLAAVCLHSLAAALLLRPAKWYLKDPPLTGEELVPLNKDTIESSVTVSSKQNGVFSSLTLAESANDEVNQENVKSISMRSLNNSTAIDARNAISHPDLRKKEFNTPMPVSKYKWWESQEFNLGSSINIFDEANVYSGQKEETKEHEKAKTKNEASKDQGKESKGVLKRFVDFFDLTLLNDPIFVNIMLGLSLATCVETNFSLLLPIILRELMQLTTSESAQVIALIALLDTVFRLVSPFIGEWCHKPPRVMYLISILMSVFTRFIMLFATTFKSMLFVAVAIGVTKGLRTVYMNVIIPSYVPIERFPFASGLQMFLNGIVIILMGLILGLLRHVSGGYIVPIITINFTSLLIVVLWSAEFIYLKYKKKDEQPVEA